jgi:hypothetical protein
VVADTWCFVSGSFTALKERAGREDKEVAVDIKRVSNYPPRDIGLVSK